MLKFIEREIVFKRHNRIRGSLRTKERAREGEERDLQRDHLEQLKDDKDDRNSSILDFSV